MDKFIYFYVYITKAVYNRILRTLIQCQRYKKVIYLTNVYRVTKKCND